MDAAVNTDAAVTDAAGGEDRVSRLAAGVLAAVGLAWLVGTLVTAHASVVGNADVPAVALGAAAFALPNLVVAALVAGAALGFAAVNLVGRDATPVRRVVVGLVAGAVLGALCAGLVVYGYGSFGQVAAIAGTVAVAALLGGAAAALPPPVLGSGLLATMAVLMVGLVAGLVQPELVGLVGGGATLDSQVTASYLLAYLVGAIGGVVSGVAAFWFLRRHGARAWPWYLLAGALPGLLLLVAELVSRTGGGSLIAIVRDLSVGDAYAIDLGGFSRLRNAMVVTFVGGLSAMVAVGRTLRTAR